MDVQPGYKEIYITVNPFHIAFIKSLFDANNIRYFIEGENFLQVRPLVAPAIIKVDSGQFEDAQELLKEFKSEHGEGTIR